jgi:hypothetical protein
MAVPPHPGRIVGYPADIKVQTILSTSQPERSIQAKKIDRDGGDYFFRKKPALNKNIPNFSY